MRWAGGGKYLVCPLDAEEDGTPLELVLHLGMTGSLRWDRGGDADAPGRHEHDRARFALDDGRTLVFRDARRFGRVSVVEAGDYRDIPTLAGLGPEPLSDEFDREEFAAALGRTTAPVKAALLSQRLVAGVGNIYADEALWRSRIHPASRRVAAGRAGRLHGALREVLAAAVRREGTSYRDYRMVDGESGRFADWLDAYGQAGTGCPRCGTTMRKIEVAQRGTTYCPGCQRI